MTLFPKFIPAATAALQTSERPIDTGPLLQMLGLPDDDIPFSHAGDYLHAAKLHYYTGLGWWPEPQWSDVAGLHCADVRTPRVRTIMRLFSDHGWPLYAITIERLSIVLANDDPNAVCVPASFFEPNRRHADRPYFRNIGLRLIAPATEADNHPVPMSPRLAARMIAADGELLIRNGNDGDYGLALLLGRAGLALTRRSRSMRSGIPVRTIRMELTPEGRVELETMTRGVTEEAGEVV